MDDPDEDVTYVVDCGSGNRGKKYAVHMYNVIDSQRRGEWELTRDENQIYVRGPDAEQELEDVLRTGSVDAYKGRKIDYEIDRMERDDTAYADESVEAPDTDAAVDTGKPYEAMKEERDVMADLLRDVFEDKEAYRRDVERLEDRVDTLEADLDQYGSVGAALDGVMERTAAEIRSAEADLASEHSFHEISRYMDGEDRDEEWQEALSAAFADLTVPVVVRDRGRDQYNIRIPYGNRSGPLSAYLGKTLYDTLAGHVDDDVLDLDITDYALEARAPKRAVSEPEELLFDVFSTGDIPVNVDVWTVEQYTPEQSSLQDMSWELDGRLLSRWSAARGVGPTTVNSVERHLRQGEPYDRPLSTVIEEQQDDILKQTKGVGPTKLQRLIDITERYEQDEYDLH